MVSRAFAIGETSAFQQIDVLGRQRFSEFVKHARFADARFAYDGKRLTSALLGPV